MLEAAGVTAVTALTEPQGHVLATDHVLLPRADYAALVALRTRAAAKLAQLKQAPLDSIRAEHLRVLEWLLGEVPHAEAPPHAEASRVRATPVKIGTCADVNARACTVALTAPSGLEAEGGGLDAARTAAPDCRGGAGSLRSAAPCEAVVSHKNLSPSY